MCIISIGMRFAYTPSRNKIFSLILWKYLNFTTFETVTNKVKFRWPLTSGQTKVTGNSFLNRTNDFWLKQNTQIGQDGQIMFTIFTIEGKLKLHCNKLLSQALEWMILLLIAAIEYGFYAFCFSCFDANIAWHNFIEIIRLPDDELKSNILKMMKKNAHKKTTNPIRYGSFGHNVWRLEQCKTEWMKEPKQLHIRTDRCCYCIDAPNWVTHTLTQSRFHLISYNQIDYLFYSVEHILQFFAASIWKERRSPKKVNAHGKNYKWSINKVDAHFDSSIVLQTIEFFSLK